MYRSPNPEKHMCVVKHKRLCIIVSGPRRMSPEAAGPGDRKNSSLSAAKFFLLRDAKRSFFDLSRNRPSFFLFVLGIRMCRRNH